MTKAKPKLDTLPSTGHTATTTYNGWATCAVCYRSWRVGAKVLPVCAPRKAQKVYY